jgi:multiple sugar transport system permease protein
VSREGRLLYLCRKMLAAMVVAAAVVPLYLLIKQAVTPELDSFAWPPVWFPESLTLAYLKRVIATGELRVSLILSARVAAMAALIATGLGTMLAYAMARDARSRGWGLTALSATRLLPMIAAAMPLATILIKLGLYDTASGLGLALVHGALALPAAAILLFSAFIKIPIELEQAAYLDGASSLAIFLRVNLPQVRGALAAAFVVSFLASWDEFGFALLLQPTNRTLPPLIYYYTVFGDTGAASALALVSAMPVLITLIALRRVLLYGMSGVPRQAA